jgi:hypothetical protein
MDALTVTKILPERCTWPCYFGIIAVIVAAVIYLVQRLRGHKSNK